MFVAFVGFVEYLYRTVSEWYGAEREREGLRMSAACFYVQLMSVSDNIPDIFVKIYHFVKYSENDELQKID